MSEKTYDDYVLNDIEYEPYMLVTEFAIARFGSLQNSHLAITTPGKGLEDQTFAQTMHALATVQDYYDEMKKENNKSNQ